MRLKGRYINDNLVLKYEPAGVYEEPAGEGLLELHTEPLSVITITPRPMPRRRTASMIRKAVVLCSVVALPVAFVALADVLIANAGLFFGSFAVAAGWPTLVFWANYRD